MVRKICFSLGLLMLWTAIGFAQDYDPNYLGTFSIIARDAKTGELGMGVQSKAFAPGNRAVHVKGGVGVVACGGQPSGPNKTQVFGPLAMTAKHQCDASPLKERATKVAPHLRARAQQSKGGRSLTVPVLSVE